MREPTEEELQLYKYLGEDFYGKIPALSEFRTKLYDFLMKCDAVNLTKMVNSFKYEAVVVYSYKFEKDYWPMVQEIIMHQLKSHLYNESPGDKS